MGEGYKKYVYKFGTGHPIPCDGIYLSTITDTQKFYDNDGNVVEVKFFVWHYYEFNHPL